MLSGVDREDCGALFGAPSELKTNGRFQRAE